MFLICQSTVTGPNKQIHAHNSYNKAQGEKTSFKNMKLKVKKKKWKQMHTCKQRHFLAQSKFTLCKKKKKREIKTENDLFFFNRENGEGKMKLCSNN